jgi:tRNA 2-thiouridine synthesizing protein A
MAGITTWVEEVDASGLLCPLPVLRARKRLKSMAPGTVLRLISTDPAALIDVPHFCNEAGHTLISTEDLENARAYLIRKS